MKFSHTGPKVLQLVNTFLICAVKNVPFLLLRIPEKETALFYGKHFCWGNSTADFLKYLYGSTNCHILSTALVIHPQRPSFVLLGDKVFCPEISQVCLNILLVYIHF